MALLVLGVRKKKLAYKIFGAVFAATGILSLLGLAGVPYLEVGIPGIMSLYFDVFSGGVQALGVQPVDDGLCQQCLPAA